MSATVANIQNLLLEHSKHVKVHQYVNVIHLEQILCLYNIFYLPVETEKSNEENPNYLRYCHAGRPGVEHRYAREVEEGSGLMDSLRKLSDKIDGAFTRPRTVDVKARSKKLIS